MRRIFVAILLTTVSLPSFAEPNKPIKRQPYIHNIDKNTSVPKVKNEGNGIYSQHFDYRTYTVDTVARICTVSASGEYRRPVNYAVVDCQNLKRRQEWSDIIAW